MFESISLICKNKIKRGKKILFKNNSVLQVYIINILLIKNLFNLHAVYK